ncbi:MAG: DUF5131 family protein [Phycisphaerales bacterium JB038]
MSLVPRTDWVESAWNPVIGCSKTSAGCNNCLAERRAQGMAYAALQAKEAGDDSGKRMSHVEVVNHLGRWNNQIHLDEPALPLPLSWTEPRFIIVNAMSDLFHEKVPLAYIRRVFEVMGATPRHMYQVLTKRLRRGPAGGWRVLRPIQLVQP